MERNIVTAMHNLDDSSESKNKEILSENVPSQRLRYLDQFRGYIMLYLVTMAVWPAYFYIIFFPMLLQIQPT